MSSKKHHTMYKLKHKIPILIGTFLMFMPTIAMALDPEIDKAINGLFQTFNIVLIALQAFLWPILILLGGLLNNDLLFSGGMQTMLLNIWTAVRDFVNILFVLGLLFVAIFNIMGGKGDNYTVKAALPKIIIAIIAVNFSFLACKVVLDVVNVGTTAIFAVPLASDSLKKYREPKELVKLSNSYCNKLTKIPKYDINSNPYCTAPKSTDPKSADTSIKSQLSEKGIAFFSNFNSRNAALVIAIELMQITNIDTVNQYEVTDIKSLSIQSIFSIIFLVIYGTAFVALFAAMLVRVVVLWIAIAMSPLSFLGMAFEGVKSKFGDEDPFFKLFFKHALIPLPVALILTIGMIMISQLKQLSPNITLSTNPASLGTLTSGMSTVQDIIAGLAAAAFIWIAAFKALSGTQADFIVNPIKSTVEGFGKNVAKLPLYLPLIPTGGKGSPKLGLAALGGALGGPEQYIRKQKEEISKAFGDKTDKAMSKLDGAKTTAEKKAAISSVLAEGNYDKKVQQKLAAIIEKDPELMKTLKGPNGKPIGEFLKPLKEGNASEADLKDFYKTNRDNRVLEAPDLNTSGVSNEAGNAIKKAQDTTEASKVPFKALDEEVAKLKKAKEDLEKVATKKGASDDEVKKAREDVEKQTKVVEKMTGARDSLGGFTTFEGFTKDGKIKADGVAAAGVLRSKYKEVLDASGGDTIKAKEALVGRIKKGISGISDNDANDLANKISATGDIKPDAPASPATGTPSTGGTPPTP